MTFRDYLEAIDDSHPMTTDRRHIADVCELCEGSTGSILELGSHAGISTAAIALAAPDANVYSVDLCDTVPESARVEYWAGLNISNIYPAGVSAHLYLSAMASMGGWFDVIFHDAAHGEAVLSEYVLAASMCDRLAIHDYEQLSRESQQRIESFFTRIDKSTDAKGRELFRGFQK